MRWLGKIPFIATWAARRDIRRRLIAYAKTAEGRKFIVAMNHGNALLAEMEAEILGAENPHVGQTIRIRLPNDFALTDGPKIAWRVEKQAEIDA